MVKKQEYLGHFYEKLGNKDKSVEHYENLLMLNSANLATYSLILQAKGIALPIDNQLLSEADQLTLKQEL